MVEVINNHLTRFDPWKDLGELVRHRKRRFAPINGIKACYMRFPQEYIDADTWTSRRVIAWNLIMRDGFLPLRNIGETEEVTEEEEPTVEEGYPIITHLAEEEPVIWRPSKKESPVVEADEEEPVVEEEEEEAEPAPIRTPAVVKTPEIITPAKEEDDEMDVIYHPEKNEPSNIIDIELLNWMTHIPKENTTYSFYTEEPVDIKPQSANYNKEFKIISKKENVAPIRCIAQTAAKKESFELVANTEVKKEQKEMFAELLIARATSGEKAKKLNITEVKDAELKRIIIAMAKDKVKVVDNTPKLNSLHITNKYNESPKNS